MVEGFVSKMGSFTSKMPVSLENGNNHRQSRTTIDEGVVIENTEVTRQADETGEGKSTDDSTSRELHCSSIAFQSYSWLVSSSPVDLFAAEKEEKATLKEPQERRSKAKYIMKYNNGKYLKSYQQIANRPAPPNARQKQKSTASSPSSSTPNHNNYFKYQSSNYEANKEEKRRTRQFTPTTENNRDGPSKRQGSSYPVGFGVVTDTCRQG